MYYIAIVEDEQECADELQQFLDRYADERHLTFQTVHFKNAVQFLENYSADYHLVFMDIQMPYLSGMDAAHRLREIDSNVLIVFLTKMAQYAIQGYSVSAYDYVVKPVSYYDFALKMSRVVRKLSGQPRGHTIILSANEGKCRLSTDDIIYIETQGHHLVYHVVQDKTYTQYATLSAVEKKLSEFHFARCNSCYLVNLKYVQRIKGYTVLVNGIELQISQPRKKEFSRRLTEFSGRSI